MKTIVWPRSATGGDAAGGFDTGGFGAEDFGAGCVASGGGATGEWPFDTATRCGGFVGCVARTASSTASGGAGGAVCATFVTPPARGSTSATSVAYAAADCVRDNVALNDPRASMPRARNDARSVASVGCAP